MDQIFGSLIFGVFSTPRLALGSLTFGFYAWLSLSNIYKYLFLLSLLVSILIEALLKLNHYFFSRAIDCDTKDNT